jgi:hypothetical protein
MRNGQTSFFCWAKPKWTCLRITRAYRIGWSFAQSDSSVRLHSFLLEDLALLCLWSSADAALVLTSIS